MFLEQKSNQVVLLRELFHKSCHIIWCYWSYVFTFNSHCQLCLLPFIKANRADCF